MRAGACSIPFLNQIDGVDYKWINGHKFMLIEIMVQVWYKEEYRYNKSGCFGTASVH